MEQNIHVLSRLKRFLEGTVERRNAMFFELRESVREVLSQIDSDNPSQPEMVISVTWSAIENGKSEDYGFCLKQVKRFIA